jgi:hypothetical protein
MAFVAKHRRQRQPARGHDRPRSHRDHDGLTFNSLAAGERNAAHRSVRVAHQVHDGIVPQHRAMCLSSAHQTLRERAGLDHCSRLARCSAGDLVTLDDDRLCAASAYEVGDRGTDRPTAADHHALARTHSATVSGSTSRF